MTWKKKISHLFKYNTCADKKAKYFRINDKHDVWVFTLNFYTLPNQQKAPFRLAFAEIRRRIMPFLISTNRAVFLFSIV